MPEAEEIMLYYSGRHADPAAPFSIWTHAPLPLSSGFRDEIGVGQLLACFPGLLQDPG